MCLGKYKILITADLPNMKDVSPHVWLEKLRKSTEKERYEICWDRHTTGGHAIFGKSLSKTTRGPIAHQDNSGALRSLNSAELLHAEIPRLHATKDIYNTRLAEY